MARRSLRVSPYQHRAVACFALAVIPARHVNAVGRVGAVVRVGSTLVQVTLAVRAREARPARADLGGGARATVQAASRAYRWMVDIEYIHNYDVLINSGIYRNRTALIKLP